MTPLYWKTEQVESWAKHELFILVDDAWVSIMVDYMCRIESTIETWSDVLRPVGVKLIEKEQP